MRTTILVILSVAAAGCGDVTFPGSSSDGGGDGGEIDSAVPGPVSVRVLSFDGRRSPLEGVSVGFFGPDGAHEATVATGADGTASSDLLAGGAVVAFTEPPPAGVSGRIARAVLDVAPGDQITIGGEPSLSGDPVATMTVNLPAVAGATSYELDTSCGIHSSPNTAVDVTFREGCDVDTFSFLALASGDGGRQYLRADDVAVVDAGTYNAGGPWQMVPTRPFVLTGLPASLQGVQLGIMGARTGDHMMDLSLTRDILALGQEEMVTLRPERIPTFDQTLVWTLAQAEQPALGSFNVVHWIGPDDETTWALDQLMLPWMGPVSYQASERALRFRLSGADSPFDATYLTLITSVNDGKTFVETQWYVVAPPGIEEIVLPEPPADLSDWFLADPENAYAYGQIVESDQIDGWAAARQLGFDPSYFPRREPLGSVTRASFSGTGGGGE